MKRYILFFLIISIIGSAIYFSKRKVYTESELLVLKGQVNSQYKIKEESLEVIKKNKDLPNYEQKILVMYSQYQQGILEVFNDYSKSRDHALKFRLTLVCAEVYFPGDKSKILDDIFMSVFNTPERLKAQTEYISNLKGQGYPNLAIDPKIKEKCQNLY